MRSSANRKLTNPRPRNYMLPVLAPDPFKMFPQALHLPVVTVPGVSVSLHTRTEPTYLPPHT
jgi:hypothetical protein